MHPSPSTQSSASISKYATSTATDNDSDSDNSNVELLCNPTARRAPSTRARLAVVPDLGGRRYCRVCQDFLPLTAFPRGQHRFRCVAADRQAGTAKTVGQAAQEATGTDVDAAVEGPACVWTDSGCAEAGGYQHAARHV